MNYPISQGRGRVNLSSDQRTAISPSRRDGRAALDFRFFNEIPVYSRAPKVLIDSGKGRTSELERRTTDIEPPTSNHSLAPQGERGGFH